MRLQLWDKLTSGIVAAAITADCDTAFRQATLLHESSDSQYSANDGKAKACSSSPTSEGNRPSSHQGTSPHLQKEVDATECCTPTCTLPHRWKPHNTHQGLRTSTQASFRPSRQPTDRHTNSNQALGPNAKNQNGRMLESREQQALTFQCLVCTLGSHSRALCSTALCVRNL